jgi:hypothetical protein
MSLSNHWNKKCRVHARDFGPFLQRHCLTFEPRPRTFFLKDMSRIRDKMEPPYSSCKYSRKYGCSHRPAFTPCNRNIQAILDEKFTCKTNCSLRFADTPLVQNHAHLCPTFPNGISLMRATLDQLCIDHHQVLSLVNLTSPHSD